MRRCAALRFGIISSTECSPQASDDLMFSVSCGRTDDRRLRGKSDTLDAVNAALAALQGKRTAVPKARNGSVEALRVLRLTRAGAVKARRVALQLTAPLRRPIRGPASRPDCAIEPVRTVPFHVSSQNRLALIRAFGGKRAGARKVPSARASVELVEESAARARRSTSGCGTSPSTEYTLPVANEAASDAINITARGPGARRRPGPAGDELTAHHVLPSPPRRGRGGATEDAENVTNRTMNAPPKTGENACTRPKKIGPTVPEDLTTYTRQKSLFDEEEPEPSCFCD